MYKRIDFSNLEGLAVYQDTLDFLQTSCRQAFGAIAKTIGDNVILNGIADLGTNYGDGWVCINGEIMPFVGGLKAAQIIVEEITDTEIFGDDSVKTVYYTKRAKLASTGGTDIADFVRLTELKTISEELAELQDIVANLAVVPSGMISMWSGIVPPAGWALCDGGGGRPDLRGKFIVGYNASDVDYNAIGKTGGEKKHTLSIAEMPSHSHTIKYRLNGTDGANNGQSLNNNGTNDGDGTTIGTNSYAINSTGNGDPHENRPPFYTLAYIIKL